MADDGELLERVRGGDKGAFEQLVCWYHASMIRLAEAHVPGRALAEEVARDTWLGVLQAPAAPRNGRAPGAAGRRADHPRHHPPGHPGRRYLGHAADPWGRQRAIFTAAITLNREDWGLTWNLPLDVGGLLVSTQMRIEIDLEAVLQP